MEIGRKHGRQLNSADKGQYGRRIILSLPTPSSYDVDNQSFLYLFFVSFIIHFTAGSVDDRNEIHFGGWS